MPNLVTLIVVDYLINNTKYQDLLLLFLLLYFNYRCNISKLKDCLDFIPAKNNLEQNVSIPLLLVFDNIDHMEIESNNHNFPVQIESVVTNCMLWLKNHNSISPITMANSISCIFCLRDANFALVNRALAEIIQKYDYSFYPSELDKIFKRRCEMAKNTANDVRKNLLDYFFYEDNDYTRNHFLPLFNFNYRKLIEFVEHFNVNGYLHIIEKLPEIWDNKIVIRRIIYYLLIRHLRNNDYLKLPLLLDGINVPEGKVEHGEMNAARIILTIIHNISQFYITEKGEVGYYASVSLYELYEKYSKIFTKDNENGLYFFQCLSTLFLCHKDNFCHLITLLNKELFTDNLGENFKEEMKSLEKINHDLEAKYSLAKIKLQINPSGFIYLNDIMRHYEFFSMKIGNKEPLFTCMDLEKREGVLLPTFLENIKNTYQRTKRCVDLLKEFIQNFHSGIEGFERSNYCFKLYEPDDANPDDYKENPRLYLVRIIDTHIRYIDNLRGYILKTNILRKKYRESKRTDKMTERDFMKIVNDKIVEYIEQYILMLQGIKEKKSLFDFFIVNLQNIKNTSIVDEDGTYHHIPINKDRLLMKTEDKNYGNNYRNNKEYS
ncbi:MAG: hypothetical protein LBK58_02010 [Prevotellaceae bacterium]|jgi:hypothetical protein|nr:hypothetical protein [Prevotellaceae bacterium]